ncbi:MAG: phosphonate ABC transporter, permease protein PhnE [Firmicutes bacterium]|nr:phosphonate ABC transporter, permease protein PhnE [Bacillota bacterium]
MKKIWTKVKSFFKETFAPSPLVLSDGTISVPPKPIMPYILIGLVVVFYFAAQVTNFSLWVLITRFFNFQYGPISYIKRFFPVDWSYMPKVVDPILETIQMSFLGSFLGSVMALPAAFLASNNLTKNKFVLTATRGVLSIFRSLPILIYAVFFKLIFGLGALPGTIAIAVFTFGIVAKMLFEKIETIDLGAYQAIQSTGASKLRSFISAIIPEILPSYYSMSLYAFEINIRYAAILGYVGAGGIGFDLDNAMKIINNNNRIIPIVLFIFITVVLIENLSRFLRRRLG